LITSRSWSHPPSSRASPSVSNHKIPDPRVPSSRQQS
jgi:hypothetical protein